MTKKLKILLLPQFTNQTIPMRTQTAEIFGNHLSKRHQITSLIMSKSKIRHFYWNDIEFFNLPPIKFLKKIFQILRGKEHYDLIYLRDSFFLLCVAYLIKKINKSYVSIHEINSIKHLTDLFHDFYHPKWLAGQIIHNLHLNLMKKIDLVLPTSEWMGEYLISQGIKHEKVYNLPNGANVQLCDKILSEGYEKEYDYIYIGTMDKVRELEILIKAMKHVKEKLKNALLLMVGTGNNLQHLKDLSKSLELEKNIKFTGLVPYEEVPKYIIKSRVGLSPVPPIYMYKVSSPLKIFEYWGCNVPVIANRGIPSHVKAISENKGGILVDYDEKSFSEAMVKLGKNHKLANKMGQKGRIWIEKNRTYQKLAEDFEKRLLDDLR